ncbi:MAG: hypothetical protein V3S55_09645 [Nitrospiraceae bacterium]
MHTRTITLSFGVASDTEYLLPTSEQLSDGLFYLYKAAALNIMWEKYQWWVKTIDVTPQPQTVNAELLHVCDALAQRLDTNNGQLPLGSIQQRGWRDRLRAAIAAATPTTET